MGAYSAVYHINQMKRISLFLLAAFAFCSEAAGQTILIKHVERDTAYIKDYYSKHLILRIYESTKFNNFKFIDHKDRLVFKPNDHNNFGVGFNYRFISLNFGFYIPDLSKSIDIYGKTRQLDLQTHVYLHKLIADLYLQFYHGYYLSNTDETLENFEDRRVVNRPDIDTRNASLVAQYVFNDQQFSYNAAFYQNERQVKSAGSLLAGGGIYHTALAGDSSLIPTKAQYINFFNNARFNRTENTAIGVNAGYAYTFIIRKYFFLTGFLSAGTGINYAVLTNTYLDSKRDRVGLQLNITERLAMGYNDDRYFAGITYIRLITKNNATDPGSWQEVNTGNFRVTVARRFRQRKELIPENKFIKSE